MSNVLKTIPRITLSDVLSSLVVLLVALPLCLGVAVAVGLPPILGLLSGVVGGLIVAPLGGSRLQITGPPAGLVPIVWDILHTHGAQHLGVIVLMAGLFQVAFSFLKSGHWFRSVPSAVMHAMLGGIGLLIMASQAHVMLDMTPHGSWLANVLALPSAVGTVLFGNTQVGSSSIWALQIGLVTIGVMLLWDCCCNLSKHPVLLLIPPQLLGVAVAIVVAASFQLPIHYISLSRDIWAELRWLQWPDLAYGFHYTAVLSALILALVASTESLLTAVSLDKLKPGESTDCDKELLGQGFGNVVVSLFGGMPITGVIAQGATNVRAGAETKWPAVLHGVWILLFVAVFPICLQWIPTSSLAAVLIYTGFRLLNPLQFGALWRQGRFDFCLYGLTIVAIVLTNLLEGIVWGLVLFALKLLVERFQSNQDSQATEMSPGEIS